MSDLEDMKGWAAASRVEDLHKQDGLWKGSHMDLHLEMAREWGEVVSEMRVAAEAYREAKKLTPAAAPPWKRALAVGLVIVGLGGGFVAAGVYATEKASKDDLAAVRLELVRATTRMETQIEMLGVMRPGGAP